MVYEPGGYNFIDYIKLGLPLQIVCGIFTVAIVFSIDYWWVYTVVFAVLSPIAVGVFFFLGCNKPHANQAELDSEAVTVSEKKLEEVDSAGNSDKVLEVVSVRCDDDQAVRS